MSKVTWLIIRALPICIMKIFLNIKVIVFHIRTYSSISNKNLPVLKVSLMTLYIRIHYDSYLEKAKEIHYIISQCWSISMPLSQFFQKQFGIFVADYNLSILHWHIPVWDAQMWYLLFQAFQSTKLTQLFFWGKCDYFQSSAQYITDTGRFYL